MIQFHSELGDDLMSDRAQRVLDELIEYDAVEGTGYPIMSIRDFFDDENITTVTVDKDYEALTADEEKQVIQAFLKFAY